jgi:3D-(3,5/4)-trihydroxycyclohexane-1,2-dione acylhydrolase (decyclizing)
VTYAEAAEALRELAEATGIPVAQTQAGKGALPFDHPQSVGAIGATGTSAANALAREADVVVGVGTRWSDFTTASLSAFADPGVRFAAVNVTPMDAAKLSALAVVADARQTLVALAEALRGWSVDDAYRARTARLAAEWDAAVTATYDVAGCDDEPPTQGQVIGLVNEVSGPRDVVLCAAGSMPGDLHRLWRTRDPKGYHVEYGYSCMGYEIPAGLGVKLADPDRDVVVMIGDGSYLMLHTEIVTAIQEGVRFTIVVVDNHGFQSIHGLQMGSGSPSFGNELRFRSEGGVLDGPPVPVDFAANAESLGARAIRAKGADGLRDALEEAKAADRVTVVTIDIDPDPRVGDYDGWWDVPIAEVSAEPSVNAARAEYEKAIQNQRVV